jgi:hypothetical protein
MARAKTVKKGGGRNGKSVKDYQRGDKANGYKVAVDGEDDERGEGDNSKHFDPNGPELREFLDLVADEETTIANIMDAARKKAEGPRGAIKTAKKALVESGYHAKELATLMRRERLKRKLEHTADNLDDEQILHYRSLERALGDFGDTDLGRAALASAQPN